MRRPKTQEAGEGKRRSVPRAFKSAGFPLRRTGADTAWYQSSVLDIRYGLDTHLTVVYWRGATGSTASSFDSHVDALRWIQARLEIQCVSNNPWALRRESRASFRLIMGGAA